MRMWAVWKGNHGSPIGYVLGDHNADIVRNAIGDGFLFRPSRYPVPKTWGRDWLPVWKGPHAQWGAFVEGWSTWVSWKLERAGHYAQAAQGRFTSAVYRNT